PFMVLPLFATLEKLDPILLEAAGDLGSTPRRAFFDITLPLSLPGVIAGSMLVFIPAVGEFVIPSLLGGPNNPMCGRRLSAGCFGTSSSATTPGRWPRRSRSPSWYCSRVRSPSTSTTACASSRPEAVEQRSSPALLTVLFCGIALLYLPILVLIGYSFNAS